MTKGPPAQNPWQPAMQPQATGIQGKFMQALALHQRGQFDEAEPLYRAVIKKLPKHFDALHLLGVLEAQRGNSAAAVKLFDLAIKIDPLSAAAHSNRGNTLLDLKQPEKALGSFERALRLQPNNPETLNNRGNALADLKRYDEALASYENALQLKPDYAEALNNRGDVLLKLDRPEEALASCERALELRPDYSTAHNNLGNALTGLKRFEEALTSYDRAIHFRPDYPEAYNNRGMALSELKRHEDAVASFRYALDLKSHYADAINNLGKALQELKHYDEAIEAFVRLSKIAPDYPSARGNLFNARLQCCDWMDYEKTVDEFISLTAKDDSTFGAFSFLAISANSALQLKSSTKFSASFAPATPASLWSGERYQHDRIRIAYLSSDFYNHAVTLLMAGLFERHDRSRFEVIAVSFGDRQADVMRERLLKSFDQFIDVRQNSDLDVAQMLREMEIDIAVDLNGHTENCRNILAYRPAPIQVNYLGFPGTMGAPFIDYIIGDTYVIPPDRQPHYSEKVVYLPDTYQVNDSKRVVAARTLSRAEARLPQQSFVFCCFNNSNKITPQIFDVWMRLLHGVRNGVLWLIGSGTSVERNLRREAQDRGIVSEKLIFSPRLEYSEYLASYRCADLFLDTLPFNAGTTASDALWAGLPVLTCSGDAFASRMAGSLLNAIGLPELITRSLEDYESLALNLATTPEMLSDIKARLVRNRATHPLFDTDRFCRHIESAYITMWKRYQHGEPPQSFAVQPL
jgi:protein O-GlcNAc transferase